MKTVLGWLFSGAWNWFLGKLGISTERQLGRAEVTNTQLKAQLFELKAEDAAARDIPHGKTEIIEALKNGEL